MQICAPPAARVHAVLGVGAGSVHIAERGRSAGVRGVQFSRCGCMSECMLEPLRGFFQVVLVIFPGLCLDGEKSKCEGGSTSDTDFIYEKGGRVRLQAVA